MSERLYWDGDPVYQPTLDELDPDFLPTGMVLPPPGAIDATRLEHGHWVVIKLGARIGVTSHLDPVVKHMRAITRATILKREPRQRDVDAVSAWLDGRTMSQGA